MRPSWETITTGDGELTERLRIPNGWLYRTQVTTDGVALVFVPLFLGDKEKGYEETDRDVREI